MALTSWDSDEAARAVDAARFEGINQPVFGPRNERCDNCGHAHAAHIPPNDTACASFDPILPGEEFRYPPREGDDWSSYAAV